MSLSPIDISATGMRAQRLRMDLIANNIANLQTTSARTETVREADGRTWVRHVPYRRKMAVFTVDPRGLGVSTPVVVEDKAPFRPEHDPGHPHAVPADLGGPDAGLVYYPNVEPIMETVDMMAATRAYEANLSAVDAFKAMASATLRILA
jgi:flagellar basal-body rod protein FlgC